MRKLENATSFFVHSAVICVVLSCPCCLVGNWEYGKAAPEA
jgi:hypothetical protein